MWNRVREDFLYEYRDSGYRGRLKKTFHVLTSPGFQAVVLYRMSHWLTAHKVPLAGIILQRISEVWTGISISPKTQIGPGLLIYHCGGIVVNQSAVLGSHCKLHHGVTIGNRNPGGPSPVLGDRVMVGAGAKLLGGIRIGNDAQIGANAVVLNSVPDGAVAVGIPAKIMKERSGERNG